MSTAAGAGASAQRQQEAAKEKRKSSMLSVARVTFMAMIVALVWSGMVPREDMVCVGLASLYIAAMARFVFPPVTARAPRSVYAGSKVLRVYVTGAAWVGIYLPLLYTGAAVAKKFGFLHLDAEDEAAVRAAAPHLFLLCCQVLTERLTFECDAVSLPVRALVPVLYNSGRLVSIWEWIEAVFYSSSSASSSWWLLLGRALAVSNLLLWVYNLFAFLIPMFIPICFKSYFEDQKAWKERGEKEA